MEISPNSLYFQNGEMVFCNLTPEHERGKMARHRHETIEIAYVAEGHGYHQIGETETRVSQGDLIVLNTEAEHVFIRESVSGQHYAPELMVRNILFLPEFLDPALISCGDFRGITDSLLFSSFFVEDRPALQVHLTLSEQHAYVDAHNRMLGEFRNKAKGYRNMLRASLVEIITLIFRSIEREQEGQQSEMTARENQIHAAMGFLGEHFRDADLGVNEVAVRSFLSRSYFSRLFKETTGSSFSEYLQRLRVDAACKLLSESDRKVAAIMEDVGFRDIKHFNKLFRSITGTTPGAWRKRAQSGG